MYCMFSSQESIGSAAGSHVLRSAQPLRGRREAAWQWGSSAPCSASQNSCGAVWGLLCVTPESFKPPFPGLFG